MLLFIKKECKPRVPVEDVTLVTNLLRLLRTVLTPAFVKKLMDPAATPAGDVEKVVDTYFVFCAIWALGSTLSQKDGEDYRIRFSDFWRGEFKTVRMPSRETVFDYWLDPATLNFEPWKQSPHYSQVHDDSRKTASVWCGWRGPIRMVRRAPKPSRCPHSWRRSKTATTSTSPPPPWIRPTRAPSTPSVAAADSVSPR
jgi:hypothetical protein